MPDEGDSGQPLPSMHAGVGSRVVPGAKASVSDPIGSRCTFEDLFDEMLSLMQEPVRNEDRPVIKVILDGEKIREFSQAGAHGQELLALLQRGSQKARSAAAPDVVQSWQTLAWSHRDRFIHWETHSPEDGTPLGGISIRFLSSPFQVEVMDDNQSGDLGVLYGLALLVEHAWLRPALQGLEGRRVRLYRNLSSPSGEGKSAMTQALDEVAPEGMDYGSFFDGCIQAIRELGGGGEDLEDAEFVLKPPDGTRHLFKYDKAEGHIVSVASLGLKLICTTHFVVHRAPLCIESWKETNGRRMVSRFVGDFLLLLVEMVLFPDEDESEG